MTWIKPSFVWMGYRCGWTRKDANQSRVLAIDLHRASFDKLLLDAVLASAQQGERSDRDDSGASAAIVVQWDPERALGGDSGRHAFTHPLPAQRSLQMGLRGEATRLLAVADGIVAAITDVTSAFAAVGAALEAGEDASSLLPVERPYPLPEGCTIADRSVATAAAEVAVAQGERLGASQLERWPISYAWCDSWALAAPGAAAGRRADLVMFCNHPTVCSMNRIRYGFIVLNEWFFLGGRGDFSKTKQVEHSPPHSSICVRCLHSFVLFASQRSSWARSLRLPA